MKNFLSLILIIFFSNLSYAQSSISSARLQPLGSTVTVTGVVTNGDELGVIRYMEDSTAGIALYDLTTNNYLANVNRGDSLTITGELADYNGLLEVYVTGFPTIHSSNNNYPIPQIMIPAQIGEATESELVQIDNAIFVSGGSLFSVGTYDFTSGGQSGKIYIRSNHPLIGLTIPVGPISLIGISSQYTFSVPAIDGYQILPRDTNDLIIPSGLIITSAVTQSNITSTGFDLTWNTSDSSTTEANYAVTQPLTTHINGNSYTKAHTISLSGLQPATFYFVECFSVNGTDTAFSNVGYYSTASNSTGKIRPYFNHSVDNSVSLGVDAQNITTYFNDTIKAYMDRADSTIDICVYNASDATIATAINDAYNRGVNVRYIADDDVVNSMLNSLNPNIPVVYRDPSVQGIMHNKFVIIDAHSENNSWIMSGSTNWTNPSNLFNDYNNLIFIQDQALAKAYTLEFNEMWSGVFGSNKSDNTPHKFNVNGVEIELYFSPSDNTTSKINEVIKNVNYSLEFALLSFTRDDLANNIIDKDSEFGVVARGIIEDENTTGSEFSNLYTNNVNVKSHAGIANSLHHKYLITDANVAASDPTLLTGSHNWSNNAENNSDENTLIIHDQTIANIYLQEFTQRFNELSSTNLKALENLGIDIFPNPTNGRFYFSNHELIDKIMVYNNLGELVHETSSCSSIEIKKKGIYLVKILNDKSEFFKKIVIN